MVAARTAFHKNSFSCTQRFGIHTQLKNEKKNVIKTRRQSQPMARDGRERSKTCTWNRVCDENNNATVGSGAVGIAAEAAAAAAAAPATPTAKRLSHCCFRFLCTVLQLRAASLFFTFLWTHAHAAKQKKQTMRVILTIYTRRYIRCDFSQQVVSAQQITIYFLCDFRFFFLVSFRFCSVRVARSSRWIFDSTQKKKEKKEKGKKKEIRSVRKRPELKQFAHCLNKSSVIE